MTLKGKHVTTVKFTRIIRLLIMNQQHNIILGLKL